MLFKETNSHLFYEYYETHKYTVGKIQLLIIKAGGIYSYQWASEG
jgi:hypothetical protein